MAELGKNSNLENEIDNKINDNKGLDFIIGDNLNSGVGTICINIDVNKNTVFHWK